jgi:hypothetical protein
VEAKAKPELPWEKRKEMIEKLFEVRSILDLSFLLSHRSINLMRLSCVKAIVEKDHFSLLTTLDEKRSSAYTSMALVRARVQQEKYQSFEDLEVRLLRRILRLLSDWNSWLAWGVPDHSTI